MLFKPSGNLFYSETLVFNAEHQFDNRIRLCAERISIFLNEGMHRLPGGPLVPVHKRMIEDKGVSQRRCFGEEIRVKVLPTEGCPGALDRGVQQLPIPKSTCSAKLL